MELLHARTGLSSRSLPAASASELLVSRFLPLSLRPPASRCSQRKKCGKVVFLSISVPQYVRRPTLPKASLFAKPATLISERAICTDIQPGRKLEFRYAKQPTKDFCEFIETTSEQEVVAFFRDIAYELEVFRQLHDYHMKVRDEIGDFRIEVYFGDDREGPDVSKDDECISCCDNANLFPGQEPGMTAGECILQELSDQPYTLCCMDAKGRSGFSITPVRHVEKMSDLDDDELFSLWKVAVKVLHDSEIPFISMILNHGTYRTLYHLHLKLWIENELYQMYRETKWSEERKEIWRRLQTHAVKRPKKQRICFFFKKDNSCRHGDLCSYLHEDSDSLSLETLL